MKKILLFFLIFSLQGCFSNPEKEILRSAENEWNQRRYNNSVEKYRQLVEQYPNGKYVDDALFRLGEIYRLNLEQEKEALVYFYRLVKKESPKYKISAQENIANIYQHDLRDYDQAIIEYSKLIHMDPSRKNAAKNQYELSLCYFKKGDYVQAVTEFEILLKDYPDSEFVEHATYQKYNCYFILGSCDEAIVGYQNFLKKFPDSKFASEAKYSEGNCLEEKEDLAGALAIYKSITGEAFNKSLVDIKIQGIEDRLKKRRR
ncbi:MAG: tetratricopeptide repeat protein [Nitrospinae bacterium]|nr:tetratricopeptide repeat protein [Nitrospinota bacterium]